MMLPDTFEWAMLLAAATLVSEDLACIGAGALFSLRHVAELTDLSASMVQRLSKTERLPRLAHPGIEGVRIAREDLVRFLLTYQYIEGNVRPGRRGGRHV